MTVVSVSQLSFFQMDNLMQLVDADIARVRDVVFTVQSASSLPEAQAAADEILLSLDDLKNSILRSVEATHLSGAVRVKAVANLLKMPVPSPSGLIHPVVAFISQTRHATAGSFGLVWSSSSSDYDCSGLIACGDITIDNALLSAMFGAVTMAIGWKIRQLCFVSRSSSTLSRVLGAVHGGPIPSSCSPTLVERIKKQAGDNALSIVAIDGPLVAEYTSRHANLLARGQSLAHASLFPKSSINM